ncbi:MAG: polyhydroxyalkanoate synthesis repressor PhaR [Pseudomonadota bacterium]
MAKKLKSEINDMSDSDNPSPILIKKYPNRRLYNTSTSSYIVLDDIIELVKANTPFVIEDKKTGEDITRGILNQIIFEQETKPNNYHFPLEVQKQLISMYGDSYSRMMPDYLTQSLSLFMAERSRMAEAVEDVVGRNAKAIMDYGQQLARQNMEMFKQSMNMMGALSGMAQGKSAQDDDSRPEPNSEENTKGSSSKTRGDELQDIQDRIDALQNRLKKLK